MESTDEGNPIGGPRFRIRTHTPQRIVETLSPVPDHNPVVPFSEDRASALRHGSKADSSQS